MAYTKSGQKAVDRYISKTYDQIILRVPKGKRAEYKEQAEKHGKSLQAYIIDLIEKDK